ncbi:MAG: glycosyltransferase family 2 protein [Acidobacteriota bacterium]|jgi:GT2 family glycosyltransferase
MSLSASDTSVVTINWNGRHHLETLLPSLIPLTPREIIVVDNGSTDGSVRWLKREYPAVRVIANSHNRGFAEPNNIAAEAASGSVLAFINNDMRCHEDWLKAGLEELEGAACAASRILDWQGARIDFNGSSIQYLGYALQKDIGRVLEEVTAGRRILFPCGGAMFIRKDAFLKVGGFDADFFAVFEDVDLGWRLWLCGEEVRFSRNSVCYHRGHGTFRAHSTAKLRYLMHRNALLTIIKNYADAQLQTILPLAVVMALKRAVRLSGVCRERFYLWAESEMRAEAGDPTFHVDFEDALNHLVAVDDVLGQLPALMEKRRQIQALRKRPDEEIIGLFGDPLRSIVEDPDYIEAEAGLLRGLGLDRLFDVDSYAESSGRFPSPAPERIRMLREELKQLQWTATCAAQHPPLPKSGSRLRRFLDTWRSRGLATAVRRTWEALRRED